MILKLRRRHRFAFAVLGVLLPVALAIGIVGRRAVPQGTELPPELAPQTRTFTATGNEFLDLFPISAVRVSLWQDLAADQFAVSFSAAKGFAKPDLIAYWNGSPPADTNQLPAQAVFLGAFVAGPLALPAEATATEGCLILYSLADQEMVDVSKPVRFAKATR